MIVVCLLEMAVQKKNNSESLRQVDYCNQTNNLEFEAVKDL